MPATGLARTTSTLQSLHKSQAWPAHTLEFYSAALVRAGRASDFINHQPILLPSLATAHQARRESPALHHQAE